MSSKEEKFKLFCELRGQEVEYQVGMIWKKGTLAEWYDYQVYCFGFKETDVLSDVIRPKPKPTWRETLKEKLKDYPKHFALVCSYMAGKDLDKEFTKWFDFEATWTGDSISFDWSSTEEGNDWWDDVYMFLIGKSKDLPPLPKKERYLTAQELKGKWLYDPYEKEVFMVTRLKNDKVYVRNWAKAESSCFVSVETLHKKGFKLEDGSPLLVEDNEGGE